MQNRLNILYCSEEKRGRYWQNKIRQLNPDIGFFLPEDGADLATIDVLIIWQMPEGLVEKLSSLKAVFTVSAGVDQIDTSSLPEHVDIIRMIDGDLADQVSEFTVMAALMLHRRIPEYSAQQRRSEWQALPVRPAPDFHIGVMGTGQQGRRIIQRLKPFGFNLSSWSKSGISPDTVPCFSRDQLEDFLENLNLLICILPLTTETRGILNKQLFDQLPDQCSLINTGRGEHLIEQDLLEALESGKICSAILDVSSPEPPQENSALWNHPGILLTPHIAGVTSHKSGFDAFYKSLLQWQKGEKPAGLVSRQQGY